MSKAEEQLEYLAFLREVLAGTREMMHSLGDEAHEEELEAIAVLDGFAHAQLVHMVKIESPEFTKIQGEVRERLKERIRRTQM